MNYPLLVTMCEGCKVAAIVLATRCLTSFPSILRWRPPNIVEMNRNVMWYEIPKFPGDIPWGNSVVMLGLMLPALRWTSPITKNPIGECMSNY